MSSKVKAWISAARPRTLPLSISGILTGSALAVLSNEFDYLLLILALLTTLSFQILSNFANDYGDGVKGTDNVTRLGPKRAIQSGTITDKSLKKGIVINAVISLILAFLLISYAFQFKNIIATGFFFLLAILSIVAAIKYTVGNNAYGYSGLGDVFVFIFFGGVSVIGVYYLYKHQFLFDQLLPASAIGFLSVAVLNLNNMRDSASDLVSNKITLAIKLGRLGSKVYHISLILLSLALWIIYFLRHHLEPVLYISFIAYLPLFIHIIKVIKNEKPQDYDPELKKVALSCFGFSLLLFVISFWV